MMKYVCLLVLTLFSFFCYHWYSAQKDVQDPERAEAQPNFIATNLTTYRYNQLGYLYEIIHADHAETYISADLIEMTYPSLTYYPARDPSSKKVLKNTGNLQDSDYWHIKADSGSFNSKDSINLRNNVKAQNYSTEAFISSIESGYLELDFTTNEVRTPEMVYINGKDFSNSCKGLNGNLDTKYFELMENCHATYTGTVNR